MGYPPNHQRRDGWTCTGCEDRFAGLNATKVQHHLARRAGIAVCRGHLPAWLPDAMGAALDAKANKKRAKAASSQAIEAQHEEDIDEMAEKLRGA